MQLIAYIILYPIIWLISLLPLRVLYFLSKGLYFLIYYVARYRRKVVYENLRKSFPEKPEKEIEEISKKFYRYFSRLLLEIIKLVTITEKEFKSRITIKNPEVLLDLYNKGLHCIAVTAHYCNWEWYAGTSGKTPYKIMSLYKPLSNKYVDKLLTNIRTKFGADLVPMSSALRAIIKYKKAGTLACSGFIADQTPVRQYIQYWTTFLNQDTPILLGVEKVAKQTNQAVVFLKMMPVKLGYYEIEVIKLFEDVSNLPEYEVTETHVRLLEKIIIEQPEYWLWTHRRWKLSHLRKEMEVVNYLKNYTPSDE
jgi:KDO2-lipid IV(A) lauroyltransferase